MESNYADWLIKQGNQLFKGGGIYWRLYQGALIPATVTPCFVDLESDEAKTLLKESGALFLRYSSESCEDETEWWYVLCDKYAPEKISSKTRYNIKRSNRMCTFRSIDAEWLADNGYECYSSAYNRYKNAVPVSKDIFRDNIISTKGGPYEYWGVFVGDELAGYCQCIVEGNYVATSVSKYNPAYLKHRSSYALIGNLVKHYVAEREMTIVSGNRNIAHDTNYQKFLINLGYKRQFCRLNLIYQPWLKYAVQTLFPLRKLIANLPDRGLMHKMQSMLSQEELRRTF